MDIMVLRKSLPTNIKKVSFAVINTLNQKIGHVKCTKSMVLQNFYKINDYTDKYMPYTFLAISFHAFFYY